MAGYGEVLTDGSNLVVRALALVGQRRACPPGQAHPRRRRPGRRLGRRRRRVALGRAPTGPEASKLATKLGSDVPFCLAGGGRARVTGIGEVLARCRSRRSPGRPYTLLVPPFGVSTAAVYRAWDEMGGPVSDNLNDLEPAALRVEPRLADWRDRLGDATRRTAAAGRQRLDVVRPG